MQVTVLAMAGVILGIQVCLKGVGLAYYSLYGAENLPK